MEAPKNFVPEPFGYHEEVELRIEGLTNLGTGLGRVDGWVVMVPFTIPGERVRGRIYRNHPNYSEADLLEVREASPERVEPRCPLFGTCGGCQYQHLSYPAQLRWKREQIEEAFARIGGLSVEVAPPVPSPREYGYRSKLTPHYHRRTEDGNFPIGFLRAGQRNRLVDVPSCPIATPAINEALPGVREAVRQEPAKGKGKRKKTGATLLLRETMEGVETDPKAMVLERVGDRVFQFRAGEFFQNNPFLLPRFVSHVVDRASEGGRFLVDAYCGAGLFAVAAADRFERVVGIEVSDAAVRLADSNAGLNGAGNAEFRTGETERLFAEAAEFPPEETCVVLDPPRRGCDEDFLKQLVDFRPARIVYVSCEPSTQARDLAVLAGRGGAFSVVEAQPFDLFPQTRHVENVAVLVPAGE